MLVFDDDDDAEATSKDSANGNPSFTRAKRVSFTMTTRERAMNLIQRKLWSVSRYDASTCRRLGVESCGWSRARTRRNARAFVGSRRSGARGCASRCDASVGRSVPVEMKLRTRRRARSIDDDETATGGI